MPLNIPSPKWIKIVYDFSRKRKIASKNVLGHTETGCAFWIREAKKWLMIKEETSQAIAICLDFGCISI